MPLFIRLTLTTGNQLHVDTAGVDAEPALKAFGQKAKSGDWIETAEGALVNPVHIASAVLVELPQAPSGLERGEDPDPKLAMDGS